MIALHVLQVALLIKANASRTVLPIITITKAHFIVPHVRHFVMAVQALQIQIALLVSHRPFHQEGLANCAHQASIS